MTKIFLILLFVVAGMVLVTGTIFANSSPPAQAQGCCQLTGDLTDIDFRCTLGAVVGEKEMPQGDGEDQCYYGAVTHDKVTDKWGVCCSVKVLFKLGGWLFFITGVPGIVLLLLTPILALIYLFLKVLGYLVVVLSKFLKIERPSWLIEKIASVKNILRRLLKKLLIFSGILLLVGFFFLAVPWIVRIILR